MKKRKYAVGGENILQDVNVTAKRIQKFVPNTIKYKVNGSTKFGTKEEIPTLFKSEFDTMTNAGVSPKTIDILLKQKYKIEDKGTTEVVKPKYFLGAVLGLAGQAAGMIIQNAQQKKQVAAQNKLVQEQNVMQMEQRLDTEEVSQRNFGSNTPMHSFYANGGNTGIKPKTDVRESNLSSRIYQFKKEFGLDNGKSGGAGSTTKFNPSFEYNEKHYEQPYYVGSETFNDAFAKAKRNNLSEFIFDNKRYTTEMGNNPNANSAGERRAETLAIKGKVKLKSNIKKYSDIKQKDISDTTKVVLPMELYPTREFANGGNIKQTSSELSIIKGAKHEQGGVDYKNVEVEGGEVIKHEGSNDFIFSDRIMFDNKQTYGDIAKQFTEQKGMIEKQIGMTLKKSDKLNKDYSKSGSKLKASTTNRLMEKTNLELAKLKEQDNQIEQQVEQLKEHQLQKGMALGLYNEDGTPKDTDGKFHEGGITGHIHSNADLRRGQELMKKGFNSTQGKSETYDFSNASQGYIFQDENAPEVGMTFPRDTASILKANTANTNYQNKINGINPEIDKRKLEELKYLDGAIQMNINPSKMNRESRNTILKNEGIVPKTENSSISNPSLLKDVGNFLGSNAGQAVTGIIGAGINLASNIATSKNMAKLKTPTFVPTKIQDTSKVNMSASRQAVEDSANEQEQYAEQNFANPQVAAAMKQKIASDKIKRLGEVNQQEQTTNIGIEDSNIARRAQVETANNAGFMNKQMMDYQKTSQDINNSSNVVSALVKDTNDVMTNYRKGIMEERTMDMYSKAYAGSVSEELKAAMMDGVDLQKVRNMDVTEATSYLNKAGVVDKDKLNKWLKYAK